MEHESDSLESTAEIHAIFRGRVQGVGFRATVQYHAEKRGLTGTVKNLSDGSVELYAQGPRSVLQELVDALRSDAGLSVVEEVSQELGLPRRDFEGFRVLF